MVDCMGKGISFSNYENRLQAKSGQILWVMSSGLPLRDASGKISGYRGIDMDITVRKRAEDRLQYLSTHDALTQASNRASFEEDVEQLRGGRRFPVSVIIADINNLKAVNDNHGHIAGDQMLKCACQVLRAAVRSEDKVARIGGDEFAVLLPEMDEQTVRQLIKRIREQLDQHNLRNGHVPLGMALGAATAQTGARLQEAVRWADEQMYVEKRRELGRTAGSEARAEGAVSEREVNSRR
jgi:diguanylate cyclase (GGDEF)-like protein